MKGYDVSQIFEIKYHFWGVHHFQTHPNISSLIRTISRYVFPLYSVTWLVESQVCAVVNHDSAISYCWLVKTNIISPLLVL